MLADRAVRAAFHYLFEPLKFLRSFDVKRIIRVNVEKEK
jgi:hypothetical protein